MAAARHNTPGLGIEYEVYVPAYFALLLNNNPEIEDFKLRSNVQDFGNLDDLLVDIKAKGGGNLYFGFQLKHKEQSDKNLLPTNFEALRGDFNLKKYCEAFKTLSEENRKKYHFILYTNKNFNSSCTTEAKNFCMKATQDVCCFGKNFFDTSNDGDNLFKFEVKEETKNVNKEDYEKFFSKFTLYTGQANARGLEESILKILKYEQCYATYIEFFRRWHRGDFTDKSLDKKTFNVHLVDILLSPIAIKYYLSDGQDKNSIFFEEMVQQFDITIIDASKQEFTKQLYMDIHKYPKEFNKQEDMIRLAKDYKFIDRFAIELKEGTKLKLLRYFYQKPLILDFNTDSKNQIIEASKLCKVQEIGIKLVIIGTDIDVSKFPPLKIFRNLKEVDGNFLEETKRRCKLSLQGRNISFEEIFEDEIRGLVTPRVIFQMLKGSFSIGEDKESLPQCYIPRTVSSIVFHIESIIKHSSTNETIIFYREERFEELKNLIQNIVNCEDYLYEDFLDGIILKKKDIFSEIPTIIILRKEEFPRKQLEDEIRKKIGKDDIRLFKVIDENKGCLLLMSTKGTFSKENYKSSKISVEENNIHAFFNNFINILCAQPGMGKSTLLKHFKNECDPNFWTVVVDLKAHNQFLKIKDNIEDILNYFLELENCQDLFLLNIKTMFLRRKKIVFFLDGLDEVENECVDRVLDITSQLSEMGFRIWLSSRQNLQQKVEQYFNIFAIDINELNKNQQKKYIENRLTSSYYSKEEIEDIVKKIFTNTDLANNRQILEIPLQLHIITQIFLDNNKSYYSNNLSENNFILTKMFKIFFEGKYKHYITKIELKHSHFLGPFFLEELLKKYENLALHSVLENEHFQKLQVERLELTQIKNWDYLGIIMGVNREKKVVFEHLTYAEYFAAKFLVKNFDKVRILKEEIFSERYKNLFLIFNIMLAEDSPLHLAIIYKDIYRIQELNGSSMVDKGGRNLLQVAACMATRHPLLESIHLSEACLVKDLPVKHFKGEDLKTKEIVNHVSSSDSFKNDNVFEWNSLDYALATGALYVVEALLEKSEKLPEFYKTKINYEYSDEVVAYYAIRFGYHRLLSHFYGVTRIISDYLRFTYALERKSIIQFLFESDYDYTSRTRIVELLTGDDINKIVYEVDGCTFLHFAVFNNDTEFIIFLLEKGADINVKDKRRRSPLFCAIAQCNPQISKLLVEKGADVNIEDKDGNSPLMFAIQQDNLENSILLVEKGADVNIQTKDRWSPLLLAVDRNNLKISKLLLEKGADVNIKDRDGKSPLFYAVKGNNLDFLKLLVDKGAEFDIKDEKGKSPLLLAVEQINLEISKFLVEKGADVNIQDERGWSPLLRAVYQNSLEILKLLLEKDADVNIKNHTDGWTPLLWAVFKSNFEISKLLVEKGANVNTKNQIDGWSPLLWAAFKSNLEISKLLVEKGADINFKDTKGESPLFLAVDRNNFEISQLFIEKRADINIKTMKGKSPLFLAVDRNNLEISKLLVEKGADVNVKDKSETSLLGLAANLNNVQITKFLVEKGADVNIQDKDGWSPLLRAVHQNNLEMSKLLIEKGADVNIKNKIDGWSPLLWAANLSNFEISELIVEKGADVNIKDKYGASALVLAVKQNNFKISKLLIEKGADVNIKNKIDGWSPLLWAANLSNVDISKLLVEKGADVNIKDEDGRSPLLWTAYLDNLEISKLLIEKGADVNIEGEDGWVPLLLAVKKDNLEITRLLVQKGADVNIKDKHGKSPLFHAIKQTNNPEMFKLLFESGAEVNSEIGDAFYSLHSEKYST